MGHENAGLSARRMSNSDFIPVKIENNRSERNHEERIGEESKKKDGRIETMEGKSRKEKE